MDNVTRKDIVGRFPGIEDHTVLEIQATGASAAEIEAAWLLLQNEDEGTLETTHRHGDRVNRLLGILSQSEIGIRDDDD